MNDFKKIALESGEKDGKIPATLKTIALVAIKSFVFIFLFAEFGIRLFY